MTSRDPKASPTGFTPGDDEVDDDDAQLKSLRAVWLSMPDEDPPQRGLADLMAAARVKADEMAQPSLWDRITALLRRPPVLALATVMVLIGGALFIRQRSNTLEPTSPTVEGELRQDNITAAGSAMPELAQPSAAEQEKQTEEAPAITAPTAEPPPPPPTTPPRTNRRPPQPKAADTKATTSRGMTKDLDGKRDASRDKSAFEGNLHLSDDGEDDKQIAGDSFAPPPPSPETTVTAAPEADSTKSAGAAPQGGATRDTAASRAPQYIAQAKSAAARGDCTAARTLMDRVSREDAAAYRKALASDAALKKCVVAQ